MNKNIDEIIRQTESGELIWKSYDSIRRNSRGVHTRTKSNHTLFIETNSSMREIEDYGTKELVVQSYAKKWIFFDDEETAVRIGNIPFPARFAKAVRKQWNAQRISHSKDLAREEKANREKLSKNLSI